MSQAAGGGLQLAAGLLAWRRDDVPRGLKPRTNLFGYRGGEPLRHPRNELCAWSRS
jgi:hypothetical protein